MDTAGRAEPPLSVLVAESFYGVNGALKVEVAAVLDTLGLTEALADALWQIDPDGEPVARRALADRMHCDPSNVTFIVDRLEERGLTRRVADPTDRRVKAIQLTTEGRHVRQRLTSSVGESSVFSPLTAQEQTTLVALLRKCLPRST